MEQKKISTLVIDDTVYETKLTRKFRHRKHYQKPNPKMLKAFIPGIIREFYVKPGDTVKEGDKLLILEAMKMKNIVLSPLDGKIKEISVRTGEMVPKAQLILEFE